MRIVFRIWIPMEIISPSTAKFPTVQYVSLLSSYTLYALSMQFSCGPCDLNLHTESHAVLNWNCMKGYHILNFSLDTFPFAARNFVQIEFKNLENLPRNSRCLAARLGQQLCLGHWTFRNTQCVCCGRAQQP